MSGVRGQAQLTPAYQNDIKVSGKCKTVFTEIGKSAIVVIITCLIKKMEVEGCPQRLSY